MSAPLDQSIRNLAIDPSQSFAVSAPAGSGKTGLLTQRMLTLLATVEHPEEILAITFTRKAAGEMQDRIIHALWQAKETPLPNDAHAQKTWQLAMGVLERDNEKEWGLLQSPQRLRVTTIDSLCRNITQQMPLASAIGAQPQTLENPNDAYRLAVRGLIKRASSDSNIYHHLRTLLSHLDNDAQKNETLLANLLASRDQWLHAVIETNTSKHARDYFERVLQETISDHLNVTKTAFLPVASDFCRLADLAGSTLVSEGMFDNAFSLFSGITELPKTSSNTLDTWKNIANFLLTTTGNYRKTVNKNQGFLGGKDGKVAKDSMIEFLNNLPVAVPALEELLEWTLRLPSTHYSQTQWALLESLTAILPQLVAELLLVFKSLGAADFIQISQAALQALGDEDTPTDLALQLDYKIKHILIDEFQDTASTQLALIEKLTQGWMRDDGRSLFIVGDGMQSCYGFRNAKVGIFLDARQKGIGSTPLNAVDLCVNFRSQAGIVEWVNNVFQKAFPAQDEIARGAVKYSNSAAFKPSLSDSAVEVVIHTYNSKDEENEKYICEETEAKHIAQIVETTLAEKPNKTIAILVKSRSHLKKLIPALTEKSIRYQANSIDNLSQRMSIVDLHSLTRAYLDPTDRIAWLSLLRTPWIGIELTELHQIANQIEAGATHTNIRTAAIIDQLRASLYHLKPSIKGRLNQVLSIFDAAYNYRGRKSLRDTIEGIWIALGGPACLTQINELDDTQQFFEVIDRFEKAGQINDWDGFDTALKQLYAAPQAEADSRVQIMTIHKSKGLEFDTVIIPSLQKTGKNDNNDLLLMHERISNKGEAQLLLSSFAPVGKDNDEIYQFIKEENKKQNDYEATRLLYVGCTRAIEKLYLTACLPNSEGELKAPSKQSLLAKIWPEVKDSVTVTNSMLTRTAVQPTTQILSRLPHSLILPSIPENNILHHYYFNPANIPDATNPLNRPMHDQAQNRLAKHVGTLIHSALDTIAKMSLINNSNAAEFCAKQQKKWCHDLKRKGWSEETVNTGITKIKQAITQVFESDTAKWILNTTHGNSDSEVIFACQDNQGIREYIIDRMFIADGVQWVIDYKTSEPTNHQSIEMFLKQEVSTYAGQLKTYAHLVSSTTQTLHPIKHALYFVMLDKFVETTAIYADINK